MILLLCTSKVPGACHACSLMAPSNKAIQSQLFVCHSLTSSPARIQSPAPPSPRSSRPMTKTSALSQSAARSQVSSLLSNLSRLPRLVVFDLDYCLWPFWCEMYTVHDQPRLYPEVLPILESLREHKVPMALASRTPTPEVAEAFLRKLGITHFFDNIQLIPAASGYDQTSAQKDTAHFPNLRRETGVNYSHMLFFDDEHKNVAKVARLGVCSILVSSSIGVNVGVLEVGLRQYAQQGSS